MNGTSGRVIAYRIGPYRLHVADRILDCGGERAQLTPKVIDTLLVLIQNAGRVVSTESLMQQVWPDVVVVTSGLTRNISELRKALGMLPEPAIETIPRRGYRFIANVQAEMELQKTAESAWSTDLGTASLGLFLSSFLRPPASTFSMARAVAGNDYAGE